MTGDQGCLAQQVDARVQWPLVVVLAAEFHLFEAGLHSCSTVK